MAATDLQWRKSTLSDARDSCVEVAPAERIHVRDTKDRDGGTLVFERAQWAAFVDQLK